MTKHEIIDETAAYYNLGNRAHDSDMGCVYLTPDGKSCAVGRCLYKSERESLGSLNEGTKARGVINRLGDNVFKKKYMGSQPFFLGLSARLA